MIWWLLSKTKSLSYCYPMTWWIASLTQKTSIWESFCGPEALADGFIISFSKSLLQDDVSDPTLYYVAAACCSWTVACYILNKLTPSKQKHNYGGSFSVWTSKMMHSGVDTLDEQPPALGTHPTACSQSHEMSDLWIFFFSPILAGLLFLFPSIFTLCHILIVSLYVFCPSLPPILI